MIPVRKPWLDEEDAWAAHRQPACADLSRVDLPVPDRLTDHTLVLPLFHTMAEDDLPAVVGTIRRAAGLDDRLVTVSSPRAASTA